MVANSMTHTAVGRRPQPPAAAGPAWEASQAPTHHSLWVKGKEKKAGVFDVLLLLGVIEVLLVFSRPHLHDLMMLRIDRPMPQ